MLLNPFLLTRKESQHIVYIYTDKKKLPTYTVYFSGEGISFDTPSCKVAPPLHLGNIWTKKVILLCKELEIKNKFFLKYYASFNLEVINLVWSRSLWLAGERSGVKK